VLADRVDAPAGAGFALETRLAAGRAFPDLHREAGVRRLAGFFRDLRDALEALGPRGAAILTPGPLADTHPEQAYLARYLGLPLVDGDDLDVANGEARLRTIRGLRSLDVLWRRLDGPGPTHWSCARTRAWAPRAS
jgi:uncharacterized circularly permuted ATP-grasp superfamily protein